MADIKNLLFDLGGVIMDIDRERCVRSFRRLGFENAGDFLGDYGQKGPFGALEAGLITPQDFRDAVRALMQPDATATDAQIDRAFNAFLIGIPAKRLQALRELRKHYRIYLLSNTNLIMWHGRIAEAFKTEGKEAQDYFDGISTSFEAKCLKPEADIFRYTAESCHIKPAETMFLDDSAANVEAARAAGFHALQVPPGREFTDILKEHGL